MPEEHTTKDDILKLVESQRSLYASVNRLMANYEAAAAFIEEMHLTLTQAQILKVHRAYLKKYGTIFSLIGNQA